VCQVNRFRRRSRLLRSIQMELIRQFVAGTPMQTDVHRNTATLYFHKLREIIATKLAEQAPFLHDEVEVDVKLA
jgi:transposase